MRDDCKVKQIVPIVLAVLMMSSLFAGIDMDELKETKEMDTDERAMYGLKSRFVAPEGVGKAAPVKKKKKVLVIARSRVPYIDVGEVLKSIKGGGHPGAGSATVKKGDPAQIRVDLLNLLEADPPRPRVVMDVMTSPVHTVGPKTLLSQVRQSLNEWRFTGVPVVQDSEIVGIISRRDVDSADRGDRLHLPASSCMSKPVKTISCEAPLSDALDLMVEADIGRLPVTDAGGHLIGIISRSDLLRILYRQKDAPAKEEDSG